jgi:hypothetical protein
MAAIFLNAVVARFSGSERQAPPARRLPNAFRYDFTGG